MSNHLKEPLDFKVLFESTPDLYLVLNNALHIIAASDAYLKATLVTREQILGRYIFDVFPDNPNEPSPTGVNNLRASLQRVLQTKSPDTMAVQKYDIRIPETEGDAFEERYWSPMNVPVVNQDNELLYIIHRVKDVTEFIHLQQAGTEQNKLTEELRSRTERMQMEIFLRAQEIQEANKQLRAAIKELEQKKTQQEVLYRQLKELNQLKTQFFANMSHELRTPLSLILGPLEKMKKDPSLPLSMHKPMEIISNNAHILLKHVNDLLNIAKLDAGKMVLNYQEINLAKLVRVIAENFNSLAEDKGIHFNVQSPPILIAEIDAEKVQHILLNLLSNAFKFVPAHGLIVCKVTHDDHKAIISVCDNGPGIPKELYEVIFERFSQVEGGETRKHGGTGLGLAIVKDFVELQKGKVFVKESKAGGAEFIVELPLSAPAGVSVGRASLDSYDPALDEMSKSTVLSLKPVAKPTETAEVQINMTEKPTVLVVEDNIDMNRFIAEVLSTDFHVIPATDGLEGFNKAVAHKPDLILSDAMMPRMSGEELIENLRQRVDLADTPVILLTAKNDEEFRLKLLRSGVQDYITKPFAAEELKARINNLINLRMARNKLEQKNIELEQIAYYDPLTGLANRQQLLSSMKDWLSNTAGQTKLAVLFLDLDRFKLINDALGHKIGDMLLQIIAKRISNVIQAGDIATRLGGDEFIIMLKRVTDSVGATKVAKRILRKLNEPVTIEEHKLFVTGSIGISIWPDDGTDEQALIKHADIAMYCAKKAGRNNYQFFNYDMVHRLQDKLDIENLLREALEQDKLILHYQPQYDLRTGRMVSIEALLRLPSHDGGILYPNQFLPVAEETGLIKPVGERAFELACMEYRQFLHSIKKYNHPIKLAVNFSSQQLEEYDFIQTVQNIIQKTQVAAKQLEFEITENSLIRSMENSERIILQLKEMGVSITLDDFGVGFSSLNYLRQLPLDTLKLDPTLIKNVPGDKVDSDIVSSIINLSHAIGLSVVAECVEAEHQIQFLNQHQCDKVQGFYFSKPVAIGAVIKLLEDKSPWTVNQTISK
ncbi:GGDEF domain-containing protein [Legionella taurinensis]|uniref:histidine kinase n=1 Tax=Legionella taurinensis TaxID=70611 RepID=A0AB38N8X8_9GAMM|nr:EAL domain-containing protein [Legionella taurinensis]MDX1836809.1 EAL domain-containing protein [Legionella taurinensis]PUT41227.1 hypothetical protein DB744_03895 [Legionella taurinensis]PUT42352.1 hypothetical protein DB746_07825 [Legionella taurinensis]PUT43877.1 hypothetical protein DB743_09775 [Legionella taurinensis]PUT47133.1 hypothetical protein DB745_08905 [Legionella taurinensis]